MCSTKAPKTRRSSSAIANSGSAMRRVEIMMSTHRIEQLVDARLDRVLGLRDRLLAQLHREEFFVDRLLHCGCARHVVGQAPSYRRDLDDLVAHRQRLEFGAVEHLLV